MYTQNGVYHDAIIMTRTKLYNCNIIMELAIQLQFTIYLVHAMLNSLYI